MDALPRYRTGDDGLDEAIRDLLVQAGAGENGDQLFEIITTAIRLVHDSADRLDVKIANAALKEMRRAYAAFAPYKDRPKVTIFGSARVKAHDPLYEQARGLAEEFARRDWMVVTGAGPGIMAAGLEGAGRDHAFGVNIRLPFEQEANEFIVGDNKLVNMKYFFTRKVMLMKESHGFVSMPGGFGTQDETFELLTLVQTGKAVPAPIVLLDQPGGTYWSSWASFATETLADQGYVSDEDRLLYLVTDDVGQACREITEFYRNYHSIRFVGDRLVVRLQSPPTDDELKTLNREYGDLCVSGEIERAEPRPSEVRDDDALDMARITMLFNRTHWGRFRALIDDLNGLASAPADEHRPPLDRVERSDDASGDE